MKPMASLSLDLDNEWSYLKTHGDPRWQGYPSYLDVVVPRILDLLERMQLHITFFVVGQDAALDRNRKALASISAAGHEIGNHSFHHEPWLHLYSEEEHEQEFAAAEEHIEAATGIHPVGFRGPGFSLSETTLRVLKRRRYRYDASTLPTFLGPLARAYYFMTAKLDAEERRKRKLLFGSARDGLRSIRAYKWRIGDETLLEIPVTTLPILRVPFHLSYILYLSTFSPALARAYFNDITTFYNTRLEVVPDTFIAKLGALKPGSLMKINGFEAKPIVVNLFQDDDEPAVEVEEAADDEDD